jgi:Mn2+/Fe2+ NRAMP family transporter
MSTTARSRNWLAVFAPGILVVATGVGTGDLMTASLAGSQVGLAVLWAAALGGLLKWTLNEGIARWQMATGTTLLEGWSARLGAWMTWVFLVYFLVWSLMVSGALASACGVAGDALLPLGDRATSRVIWGIVHSLGGLALVWIGGFRLFEKIMSACIAAMFFGVIVTAILVAAGAPDIGWAQAVPRLSRDELPWALGVLGGVGGTVTLLSYGYWIAEAGRSGKEGLQTCRIDLAAAYAATALFGMAMVVIGSRIHVEKTGADVAVQLAAQLGEVLGPSGRWLFLAGFWGAVFSSLLGVWQSAPYLFGDFLRIQRGQERPANLAQTWPYRAYLLALALAPLALLGLSVKQMQLAYAIMGAIFMPLVALTLLIMNNRQEWVGTDFRSGWLINLLLVATLVLFALFGALQLAGIVPSTGA